MSREAITLDPNAEPVGPFSAAVRSAGFLFVSGHVAEDPATGALLDGDAAAQATQIFANLGALLQAAGRSFDDVVRVGVYLTDMGDYGAVNEVYAQYFRQPYPARTAITVAALPLGARVEIDAVVG
jgi:2-iminobutanoate/2-iminopropanoate deaminase